MIGGVVITNKKKIAEEISFLQNSVGAIQGPFDAFLALRGLKTLPIRVKQHNYNGLKIAEFLESSPFVEKVIYPGLESFEQYDLAKSQMDGFGGIVSFYLKGNLENTKHFLENCEIFSLAESLGGVESLCCHPASMTHSSITPEDRKKSGLVDSLLRLSVGIEDADDLIEDLKQAIG